MSRLAGLLIFSILIPCLVTLPPQSPPQPKEAPQDEPRVPKSNLDETGAVVVNVKPKSDTAAVVDTSPKNATIINASNATATATSSKNKPPDTNTSTKTVKNDSHVEGAEVDSDTLKRGILVLVALSMLFLIYLGYRTYRNRSKAPNPMVRKYGVRTRRGDIEMTPLPLSDDEDDETVFELDRRPSQV